MIQKSVLTNGLRVLTERITGVRSVAVGIWVGAGSRWEPDCLAGISHLIEHLLFKGTQHLSTQQLAAEIDRIGGNMNAYTSKEYTCYSAKVLLPNLPRALELLSEILLRPRFDPGDVEREKNVIIEEIKMYEDSPEDVVHDLLCSCLWKNQSLGRAILGSQESLANIDLSDIQQFYESFYVPHNAVLAAVGDVDHQRFLSDAERFFGHWSGNFDSNRNPDVPQLTAARCVRIKDVEQVHLCIGVEGKPLGDSDVYPLLMLSTVLGGGASSRLFQLIREEYGLAYAIYTFQSSYRDTGVFGIYAATSPGTADQVFALTMTELERIRTSAISDDELERSRGLLKTDVVLSLESSSARLSRIGSSELILGHPIDPDEAMHHLDKVTRDDILRLAQQLFLPERMAVAAVAPTAKPFKDLTLEPWPPAR